MTSATEMYPREMAIRSFYKTILGRDPDQEGLDFYLNSGRSLDAVFVAMYVSDEAEKRRKNIAKQEKKKLLDKTLPITLAMFVKNNEDSVTHAINSVLPIVREVVIVDTGSTDLTVDICKMLGARVYKVGFSDFGSIRTITGHLSRQDWVLGLDSDEMLMPEDLLKFKDLLSRADAEGADVVGLPRKRWLDLEMTTQLEKEVYPDLQFRLFRNKTDIVYLRRVHEIISGTDNIIEVLDGPIIHHFQDVYKTGGRLRERNTLYKDLQDQDRFDGIKHTEKAVQDIDERP